MLGFSPLSVRPISALVDMTLPATVVTTIPATSALNVTLELFPSSGTRIAAAQIEFTTLPSDTLSNQPFYGTMSKSLTFHRGIVDGSNFGKVSSGYGELELINADGAYDATFLSDTIDGRRALIKAGWVDVSGPTPVPSPYESFPTLLNGIAEDWHLDNASLRITIRDNAFKLDVPASPNVYGGTGGVDGTADMAGKRKPRAFGALVPDPASSSGGNASPPLIDPANLVYQVNDGAVSSIPTVYDSGYALTATSDYGSYAALIAATISGGSFATCLALGLFRLGATSFGLVTCDCLGDASLTGYINDTASIVRRLVSSAATSVDLVDEGAFLALIAAQPAVVGYYLGLDESKTVRQAIGDLMGGIGGWCGFRRDGTLDCNVLVVPSGTPVASYDSIDIAPKDSLRRLDLPTDTNPPPFRRRVMGPRNWTVQTALVGNVSATRAQMLKDSAAIAASTNSSLTATIQAAHPRAKDPDPVNAYFALNADAVTEANRILSLYGAAVRSLYAFKIKSQGFVRDIGQVIQVTYPRFDLTAGKLLVIVGIADDTTNNESEITAWG